MPISPTRLKQMLADIVSALRARGVGHAVAGGMAMAVHGEARATKDLDLLIAAGDAGAADGAMRSLGFVPGVERAGFVRYVRHPLPELPELSEWADLLFARHAFGLRLLHEAQQSPKPWEAGLALPVVSPSGLILMKALAYAQDPSRLQDLADIQTLLRHVADVERPALAAAAAEIGDDVAIVLKPLLAAAPHEELSGTGPERL